MKYCVHCGKELLDDAVVCPNCGCPVPSQPKDEPDKVLNIIAFLLPIVGLILYLVYHDKAPVKAGMIGRWALLGVFLGVLLWLGWLLG